jgi:tRNA U34 5-carboxymethylaminomethyl modifying GTPase MnmE/TrmE
VAIEHANGILKARWSSLKGIRIQVKKREDFKQVCEHIVVCLILHNLMIDFNDEWEQDEEVEEEEADDIDDDIDETVENAMTGRELRERVRNFLLMWHFDKQQ